MLRRQGEAERERLISGGAADAAQTRCVELQTSLGHVGLTLEDDEELQTVVVAHVHPSDLAARSGLRPGDSIISINGAAANEGHKEAIGRINAAAAASEIITIIYTPALVAEEQRREVQERQPKKPWRLSSAHTRSRRGSCCGSVM